MFEHVGRAQLPAYFAKIRRLLEPGGLLMNHGITAGGTRNTQLGAGIGDFIERYIFPGGELLHVSQVLRGDGRGGPGGARRREPAPALRAHAVGLVGCARGAGSTTRARVTPRERGARLPAVPGRQRDGLRARLDVAAPDAGVAAQRATSLPARCAAHNRNSRSTATTCTRADDLQVQVQGRRRRDHARAQSATRCCASSAASRRRRASSRSAAMPAAIAALEAAVVADEAARGTGDGDGRRGRRARRPRRRRRLAAPARLAADRDAEALPCGARSHRLGRTHGQP